MKPVRLIEPLRIFKDRLTLKKDDSPHAVRDSRGGFDARCGFTPEEIETAPSVEALELEDDD